MSKVIQTAWAPNIEREDLFQALGLLVSFWRWFGNKAVKKLEEKLSNRLNQKVVAFDSARSALFALLKAFGIKEGDEILLQAFTCVALPNPILWSGAIPVYVDIDLTNFNIDIEDLERKISKKSKALIIQYTFGIVPNLKKIRDVCRKHNLLLIEDNCHNLGGKLILDNGVYEAGTIGDGAILSMGMEKIISATRGGFATSRKEDVILKLLREQEILKAPRFRDMVRGIVNSIFWKMREHWGKLGEIVLKIGVKLKLQELGLSKLELVGKKASWLPYRMPNSNAIMGLIQFNKLDRFNAHRFEIAKMYSDGIQSAEIQKPVWSHVLENGNPTWIRYPIVVKNGDALRKKAEQSGIFLGNWYTEVIHCKDVDMGCMLYTRGSCPKAEKLVKGIVNLPTHIGITENEVEKILRFLNEKS